MSTYVFCESGVFSYTLKEVMKMSEMRLDPVVVGEVIAAYRLRKGVTQEVLSGLADIGRTHLSAIERGGRKPTLETLYRISLALDVKMSDVVLDIERALEKAR